MRADLEFLAGDALRGRLTDTPENAHRPRVGEARVSSGSGLKPMGANGIVLPSVRSFASARSAGGNELAVTRGGATSRYDLATGFYPHRYSASAHGDRRPRLRPLRHHRAPALGYDDLGGDVRGKVLLVLDHEPGETDSTSVFDGVVTSEYTNPLKKALAAQARRCGGGAVRDRRAESPGRRSASRRRRARTGPSSRRGLLPYTLAAWADKLTIPVGQISVALADSLVQRERGSRSPTWRARPRVARGSAPVAIPGVRVTVTAAVVRKTVPDRNVLAAIEGSDPRLKNEWIVISAHPDHNGAVGDTIFHGADDNGSGAVALLAIAEAYAKAAADGQRPKRSVLFASFNSEERGPLMGSWGYVEAPAVPLDKTVAMLNMDMIGRNEEVPENGGARFRGLPVQTSASRTRTP